MLSWKSVWFMCKWARIDPRQFSHFYACFLRPWTVNPWAHAPRGDMLLLNSIKIENEGWKWYREGRHEQINCIIYQLIRHYNIPLTSLNKFNTTCLQTTNDVSILGGFFQIVENLLLQRIKCILNFTGWLL